MRVFVTGATGFVGSAVVQDLLKAGHEVTGLARSESAVEYLRIAGANAFKGDLDNLDSIREAASLADGVIHTGFNHDFSKYKENCEHDRKVITAMGDVLKGTKKPLVITSAVGILQSNEQSSEADSTYPSDKAPRAATEEAANLAYERGVRISLVRLPPSVHGKGDHGFVPMLIDFARKKGISAYVDGGKNRWSSVHRQDAARLYRLALEANAEFGIYHAVAEDGVYLKDIASVIAEKMNIPLKDLTKEEALSHFTWFSYFSQMDGFSSSKVTQEKTLWKPIENSLIEDMKANYF
jgi:nucleoside-diphosphate-sugar epimerase